MSRILQIFSTLFRTLFSLPILAYRKLISPIIPQSCIYTPTCSAYALDAIRKHGVIKGFLLAAARIGRCAGGLFEGGEDPVPEEFSFHAIGDGYRNFWRHK